MANEQSAKVAALNVHLSGLLLCEWHRVSQPPEPPMGRMRVHFPKGPTGMPHEPVFLAPITALVDGGQTKTGNPFRTTIPASGVPALGWHLRGMALSIDGAVANGLSVSFGNVGGSAKPDSWDYINLLPDVVAVTGSRPTRIVDLTAGYADLEDGHLGCLEPNDERVYFFAEHRDPPLLNPTRVWVDMDNGSFDQFQFASEAIYQFDNADAAEQVVVSIRDLKRNVVATIPFNHGGSGWLLNRDTSGIHKGPVDGLSRVDHFRGVYGLLDHPRNDLDLWVNHIAPPVKVEDRLPVDPDHCIMALLRI